MNRHRLVWQWRKWRAAHYEWAAWLAWRRQPTAHNERALELASNYLRRVTLDKPW